MWLLCSVSDNEIFSPVVCSSKEFALRKMDDEANDVLSDLENVNYDTYISKDGMTYQIVTDDNIWSWKIFHLEMKVAY